MGIKAAALVISSVLFYGIVGFYLLDKKHFMIDFSLLQSIKIHAPHFSLLEALISCARLLRP